MSRDVDVFGSSKEPAREWENCVSSILLSSMLSRSSKSAQIGLLHQSHHFSCLLESRKASLRSANTLRFLQKGQSGQYNSFTAMHSLSEQICRRRRNCRMCPPIPALRAILTPLGRPANRPLCLPAGRVNVCSPAANWQRLCVML